MSRSLPPCSVRWLPSAFIFYTLLAGGCAGAGSGPEAPHGGSGGGSATGGRAGAGGRGGTGGAGAMAGGVGGVGGVDGGGTGGATGGSGGSGGDTRPGGSSGEGPDARADAPGPVMDAATSDVADTAADGTPGGTSERDPFGVRKIHPSKQGGREWYLPTEADRGDGEWGPGTNVTRTAEAGVFHIQGSPRVAVSSPAGKAWWRNVEITAYYRLRMVLPNADLTPGYQLYARGERHVISEVAGASINQSRPAPPGTPTWPGYPFSGMINGHCLGSSYKGYVDASGSMDFKKEISHTGGYTGARDTKNPFPGGVPRDKWFGYKVVIRNFDADKAVHMESWLDPNADGEWRKINEVRDTGGWNGGSAALDGCTAPPFNYKVDQLVTWAAPYVNFRFDFLSTDLKWLSAREIDPLP